MLEIMVDSQMAVVLVLVDVAFESGVGWALLPWMTGTVI